MTFEIGVLGLGYVGGTVTQAYQRKNVPIHTYDIDANRNPSCESFEEFLNKANMIYVAVPTPMTREGACDTRIVEQVVHDLCMTENHKVIIIKSTVPPGTTEKLQERYTNHTILFSPEFLTERNALNDFLNQEVMLVGKSKHTSQEIADAVLSSQASVTETIRLAKVVDATVAELYKYTSNLFLATKVSFANEMADIAANLGVEWNAVERLLLYDTRLGKSHWMVPGPDGHRGFGGTCVLPTTQVVTPTGNVEIRYLTVHDEVISTDEQLNSTNVKKILDVIELDYDGDLYEFDTALGILTCTADHLIPVVREGVHLLIPAKDVRLTDHVYTYIKE